MTITITATVEASNVPPRVRLDVHSTVGPGTEIIQRHDPDGNVVPVRTLDGNPLPLSGTTGNYNGLVYDYEAPFGQTVYYGRVEDDDSTPPIVSANVVVPETRAWLLHPGVPSLSRPIDFSIGTADEETWTVSEGVFYPMARAYPIVVTDGARRAPASQLILAVDTLTDLEALRSLLSDASVLMLNVPPSLSLGIVTAYIAISDVTNIRPSNIGSEERRRLSFSYRIVTRPAGGTQAQRTYTDLLDFATYGALRAGYATYLDLLAGP